MASTLRINDIDANIVLCSSGGSMKAHAVVLRKSEYFAHQLKNISNNQPFGIVLPHEIDYNDLLLYVKSLYDDDVVDISEEDWPRYEELREFFDPVEALSDAFNETNNINGNTAAPVYITDASPITVLRDILTNLKPSTVVYNCERMPLFEAFAADIVTNLILSEFIRSHNTQVREAHFHFYDKLQSESRVIIKESNVDIRTLLSTRVISLFAQQVIARREDEIPNIHHNSNEPIYAFDNEWNKIVEKMRSDYRHENRAIICLFGEFYLRGWISYRSLDLAIDGLLKSGSSEKLELFCHLLILVEDHLEKQHMQSPAQNYGLSKYTSRINEAFDKTHLKIKQMYKERKSMKYKIQRENYGIDMCSKTWEENTILDHISFVRMNIGSIVQDQYYENSGGFAVVGLDTPIKTDWTKDDLKPIEPTAVKIEKFGKRVRHVPRSKFIELLPQLRESKGRKKGGAFGK